MAISPPEHFWKFKADDTSVNIIFKIMICSMVNKFLLLSTAFLS